MKNKNLQLENPYFTVHREKSVPQKGGPADWGATGSQLKSNVRHKNFGT